jgi:hypothetical protein
MDKQGYESLYIVESDIPAKKVGRARHLIKLIISSSLCVFLFRCVFIFGLFLCTLAIPHMLLRHQLVQPIMNQNGQQELTTTYLYYGPIPAILLCAIVLPIFICCLFTKETYKEIVRKMRQYDIEQQSKNL